MLKLRVAAAGLVLATVSSLVGFGVAGGSGAQTHPASVNFACAGAGNLGICIGPPTADTAHTV